VTCGTLKVRPTVPLKVARPPVADVDADHSDLGQCTAGHGRAPEKTPLIRRASLAGQEHGRTIPLGEIGHRIAMQDSYILCDHPHAFEASRTQFLPPNPKIELVVGKPLIR
jgi:hypothetical protein